MGNLLQDLRYSFRMLAKSPIFALGSILCLALSLGVGSSLFLFVDGILLRPLPVSEPDRLVWVGTTTPKGRGFDVSSYLDFVDYQNETGVFSGVTAYSGIQLSLRAEDRTDIIQGQVVSPNYFSTLGVKPQIGRAFQGDEGPVVVLGHSLWQGRFGGNPEILNTTMFMNRIPFTVIGVAPKDFRGTQYLAGNNDLWLPMSMLTQLRPGSTRFEKRNTRWLEVMARLKPGITLGQAQQSMNSLAKNLEEAYPDTNKEVGIALHLTSRGHPEDRDLRVTNSIALMSIAGFVLLIAGANVTGLLLARAHGRKKEMGVRLALGAKRSQLIRQFLIENLLLFLAGGILSLAFAFWTSGLLSSFEPPGIDPIGLDFSVSLRVVFFTFLLSLVPGFFFALLPVFQASKTNPADALRMGASSSRTGYRPLWLRNTFVVVQMAISLLLLITAGLFIRSLQNTLEVDVGFANSDALMTSIRVGQADYSDDEARVFLRQLIERLEIRPEVRSASLAVSVPLSSGADRQGFFIDGHEPPPGRTTFPLFYNVVRPGFFDTLGIPLLQGRDFTDHDGQDGPWVAVINQTMAERFWPGENPIGKFFRGTSHDPPRSFEIVGVVGDGKYRALSERPRPYVFLPHQQNFQLGTLTLWVHGGGGQEKLNQVVRGVVEDLDKDIPIFGTTTAQQLVRNTLLPAQLGAFFLSGWGFLALVLAAVGIYAVVSYGVVNRTFEISIRTALGSRPGQVILLVLKEALILFTVGSVLGVGLALVLTGFISDVLFGVGSSDVGTYLQVVLVFAMIVFLASLVPALQAIRINPVKGLHRN